MKVIIVGYGAIGKERARVLNVMGEQVIATIDIANQAEFTDDLISQADWIFVCTPPNTAVDIVRKINGRTKVLVEKPYMGHVLVDNVGLNYRFYRGIRLLLNDCLAGRFGDIVSVNMVLGLCDYPDADKTWRLNPEEVGRGALLDLGIHLIDLAMLISNGDITADLCREWSGFWKSGIWEEAHVLAHGKNAIYNLQVSKLRWRPALRIEVNGTDGYGIVEGRNRFYGNQTYIRGKKWGWLSGKTQRETEEKVVDYDGMDSFLEETWAVLHGCDGIQPATFEDNKRCLDFICQL